MWRYSRKLLVTSYEVRSEKTFADPDVAARKIVELANAFEPMQDEDQRAVSIRAEGHASRVPCRA
jgi:hypothetical protein